MSVAWATYRVVAPALGAVAPAARWFASPIEKVYWEERMGGARRSGGCDAWIHAASLGEAAGVGPLVTALRETSPGARFHLTSTTRTGRDRLSITGEACSLAPLDAPQIVRRFWRGVEPQRLLLVETEVWPHWMMRAFHEGAPVAVVSARLAERSVAGYRRLGSPLRDLIASLHAVLCQTEADAERWLVVGSRPARTFVTGNLKHDALPEPTSERAALRAALDLPADARVLVLGSLRPGEARTVANALERLAPETRASLIVVAVPRHARATGELRAEAGAAGATDHPAGWRWDERPGVLMRYYQAADIAFVGGSLAPWGGHNPLEPAACGAAVLMGPHHANQREGVRALADAGALRVVGGVEELADALTDWLANRDRLAGAAAAGLAVAAASRGATQRTVERLIALGAWAG